MQLSRIWRSWLPQHSIKSIARESGIDRKTVRRYLAAAEALGIAQDAVLTDDVVHEVARFVQTRPVPTPSDAWLDLTPHRTRIAVWLESSRR